MNTSGNDDSFPFKPALQFGDVILLCSFIFTEANVKKRQEGEGSMSNYQ